MRVIEKQMLSAINAHKDWESANTSVSCIDDVNVAVYLYGNHIADVNSRTGFVMVNKQTLAKWPSNTTKSRLRALGVRVTTKNYTTYLNDEEVTA
jgi:hypothetical protein